LKKQGGIKLFESKIVRREASRAYKIMKKNLEEGEKLFDLLIRKYGEDGMIYFYRGKGYKAHYLKSKDERLRRLAIEDFKKAYDLFPSYKWKKKAEIEMKEILKEENGIDDIEDVIKAVNDERKRLEDVRNRQPYFVFNLCENGEEENEYGKCHYFIFGNFHERIQIDIEQKGKGEKDSILKFGEEFFKGKVEINGDRLKLSIPLETNGLDRRKIEKMVEIAENEGIYYISDFRKNVEQLGKFLKGKKYSPNPYLNYFLKKKFDPQIYDKEEIENDLIDGYLVPSQIEAIKRALSQDLLFIWGPPGTGKTEVLCNIMNILFKKRLRVLVLSLSNFTVDELLRKFVRKLKNFDDTEDIVRLGKPRMSTPHEILNLFRTEIPDSARIVAGNFNNVIYRRNLSKFDYVLIDEVSMTPVPMIIAGSYYAQKGLILAGDPVQLPPPYPSDMEKPNEWYSKSVFERMDITLEKIEEIISDKRCVFLDTQYRMSEEISNLVSDLFYKVMLRCGKKKDAIKLRKRIYFIDTGGKIEVGREVFQRRNEAHASAIVNYIEKKLVRELKEDLKVGIITPYNSQVCTIYKFLKEKGLADHPFIKVGTVHSFQGQECEIIFFDITDVDVPPSPLIKNKKLLNVALSRAKELLIVVGDKNYLLNSGYFSRDIREIYRKIIETGENFEGGEIWKKHMLPG